MAILFSAQQRRDPIQLMHFLGMAPHVEIEATNTDLIVRMVEAGLGVAVVPLHPSGAVTRGRKVSIMNLGKQVRPIDSGVLLRRREQPAEPALQFLQFLGAQPKRRGGSY